MQDTKLIVAKIRDAEAQLEGAQKRTAESLLVLARHYQELVKATKSGKEAARTAKDANLHYSGQSNIRNLTRWAELFDAVRMEIGGGLNAVHPPFTEWQVRPILATKYWDPIGPGGMADLWPGIEDGPDKVTRWLKAIKKLWTEKFNDDATSTNLQPKVAASREVVRAQSVAFIEAHGWDEYFKLFSELSKEHSPASRAIASFNIPSGIGRARKGTK